ncbi:MAG TPA: hypothetical protein PK644_08960 [bacterium]|nr:hypothetical protein [bacterium]
MTLAQRERLLTEVKHFTRVSEETYRTMTALNYRQETVLETRVGRWEIYCKKQFVFPFFVQNVRLPVDRFVAIFKGQREFIVSGAYESLETVKENLRQLTATFLTPVRKWLGIPLTLTTENAQDYGYLRGLFFGCLLVGVDVCYSWFFKLKNGLLTGIIDFIRLVYEGNVGLAIGVGIALTGFYFGFLLIALPIIYGELCVQRAARKETRLLEALSPELLEYEAGHQAELALAEEFNTILEEKRKQEVYEELVKLWPEMDKAGFERLYQRLREGFVSPEALHSFLLEMKSTIPSANLEQFLEVVIKFRQAAPQIEIKLRP